MVDHDVLKQIHEGMEVKSADGERLGKIRRIWYGSDPLQHTDQCDEDVCSRLEVQQRDTTTYIPFNAIAKVPGKYVTLNVDAATINEKGWYRKPLWIQDEEPSPTPLRYTTR